jgi:hypothetical protein
MMSLQRLRRTAGVRHQLTNPSMQGCTGVPRSGRANHFPEKRRHFTFPGPAIISPLIRDPFVQLGSRGATLAFTFRLKHLR